MRLIPPKRAGRFVRCLDAGMVPLMNALGGFRPDSIQETHSWHCTRLDPRKTSPADSRSVWLEGSDPSHATNRAWPFPVFHAPVLGGWTRYVVLRVEAPTRPWHLGWIHHRVAPGSRPKSAVHSLEIFDDEVRVLTQPVGFLTQFFAIDPGGIQLSLSVAGAGALGDRKFPGRRLF
jgi:hypothetical protein